MSTAEPPNERIPVICISPSSVVGADIFNPNSWSTDSKGIIQSCWAEISVLHHCIGQIVVMCEKPEQYCQPQIETLQEQWAAAKFNLGKMVLLGEQPDLHMRIKAFFSGVKSLLDLMVQLLSSEKIVRGSIHGFHSVKNVYGGSVLNALQRKVPEDRKELVGKIEALINEHKAEWIDQVISARDQLVHPRQGMHQLMFQFECAEKDGKLVCVQINPPAIGAIPIDRDVQQTFDHARTFASAFIALLQETTVSTKAV